MKRFNSSTMIPTCTPKDEKDPRNDRVYNREFQSMLDNLDEEDCLEENSLVIEKKRRLSLTQVKSLEKHFEVENKLEPERKVKIAEEIGLQPRQVAIWFQNRRARWKTKQLEKDYDLLKSNYDALKIEHDNLGIVKESLNKELRELKEKLGEVNDREKGDVFLESDADVSEQSKISPGGLSGELESNNLNQEICPRDSTIGLKGSSQNSDTNEMPTKESQMQHHLWISPASSSSSSSLRLNYSALSLPNWFKLSDTRGVASKAYGHDFGRVEDQQSLYGTEESCNIFSVDQAPTLHWYNFDPSHY